MAHELPKLPYDFAALEPHIDAQTMQIHHGKHHQAYVTNLNTALEKHPDLQGKSVDDLCRGINSVPEAIRTAVRNNGGGHWNHSKFWTWMAPSAGGASGSMPAGGTEPRAVRRARSRTSAMFSLNLAIGTGNPGGPRWLRPRCGWSPDARTRKRKPRCAPIG